MSNNTVSNTQFEEHSEFILEHLEKFYSKDEITVFHEFFALDFKIHTYLIDAPKHSFNILLTSGMSVMKMNVDNQIENAESLHFAELMLLIPKDVDFQTVYTGQYTNDWMISMLKQTAKFPHQYNTWLTIGHTIQATHDMRSYDADKTAFVGGVILPSATFSEDFTQIKKDGRVIHIYNFFPLYKNELQYKIDNGYNALLDLIIAANSKEVLNNNRENLIVE